MCGGRCAVMFLSYLFGNFSAGYSFCIQNSHAHCARAIPPKVTSQTYL